MSRRPDPNQMELEFCARIECYTGAMQALLEHVAAATGPQDAPETPNDVDEFHVELAAACKAAIRDSHRSREEVLEQINRFWASTDDDSDAKRGTTLGVFNNYLSKPATNPLPTRVIYAICAVTGDAGPLECLARAIGGRVTTGEQRMHTLLGDLEVHQKETLALKREVIREISRGWRA